MTKKTDSLDRVDPKIVADLAEAGPQHVKDVIDDLMKEPQTFPTFELWAIFDVDMDAYVDLTPYLNQAIAVRSLKSRLLQGDPRFSEAPSRFRFDYLGQWDQGTGELIPDDPQALMTLEEILNAPD